jgi:hypothetical protein
MSIAVCHPVSVFGAHKSGNRQAQAEYSVWSRRTDATFFQYDCIDCPAKIFVVGSNRYNVVTVMSNRRSQGTSF